MKNDQESLPFQIMALTVPAAEAAVGKNWLPTLMLALAAFLLCTWMSAQPELRRRWLSSVRCAVIVLLMAWLMNWTHTCWPGRMSSYVVPGTLLILAMYAAWKGNAGRASSVLRYGMYLVLIALAILGVPQIDTETLRPTGELPNMGLAAVLLLPLLGKRNGKLQCNPVGTVAVAAAILTGGAASIYEYSRGLSVRGVTEHIESLAACAITIGYFSLLCFLLDGIKREGGANWTIWAAGVGAYGLYAVGVDYMVELYALLMVTFWGIVPLIWALKENRKKKGKSS